MKYLSDFRNYGDTALPLIRRWRRRRGLSGLLRETVAGRLGHKGVDALLTQPTKPRFYIHFWSAAKIKHLT